jgi:ERCC4-type nuclease
VFLCYCAPNLAFGVLRKMFLAINRNTCMQRVVGRSLIQAERTREFFKRRWLQKIFSPKASKLSSSPLNMDHIESKLGSLVKLQIDSREPALAACLAQLSVPFDSVQLPEGDVVISTSGPRGKRIVIERKSVEDFYNSVKTNRLFDQIGRVFDSFSKSSSTADCLFLLVLEGRLSVESSITPCMYTTVSHMYHSLLLRDKIAVLRTDSVSETARLVVSLGSRTGKFFSAPNDFASLVHVERSGRKINGLNVPYIKLLMSIKGVSANRANAIAAAYPSMDVLVSALKEEGGALRVAQLVCPSNTRSVGSGLGTATALNIAEALLGPSHPEVSVFKLVKWLATEPEPRLVNGEALKVAKEFVSLPGLRLRYLQGNTEDLEKIPPSVQKVLANCVDDSQVLLTGLKGVRLISSKTAELITTRFGNIRALHAHISKTSSMEEVITSIRLIGTSVQKRMIARKGVENMLAWLRSEGFSPI